MALIFADHERLSIENTLLYSKISSLELLNSFYNKSDSIQKKEIGILKLEIINNQNQLKKLKTSNKRLLKGSFIGGITLFILGLII